MSYRDFFFRGLLNCIDTKFGPPNSKSTLIIYASMTQKLSSLINVTKSIVQRPLTDLFA